MLVPALSLLPKLEGLQLGNPVISGTEESQAGRVAHMLFDLPAICLEASQGKYKKKSCENG